jgi:xanthine/uracil permease
VEFHHAHDPEIDAPTNPFFRPWVFGMVLLVLGAILLVSLAQAAAKMDANQPEQSPAKNKEE